MDSTKKETFLRLQKGSNVRTDKISSSSSNHTDKKYTEKDRERSVRDRKRERKGTDDDDDKII